MTFPANGLTTRAKTIPSYLYEQYFDDDDLQAFNSSHVDGQQEVIDALNALNLPIYTKLNGALLDWVGSNLYGINRPSLSLTLPVELGAINTFGIDELGNNEFLTDYGIGETPVSDDVYKRVITWHYWRGDGRHATPKWIKRRVARFLFGVNGEDVAPIAQMPDFNFDFDDNLSTNTGYAYPDERQIGLSYSVNGDLTITIVTGRRSIINGDINSVESNLLGVNEYETSYTPFRERPELAFLFVNAVNYGVLEMPFQHNVYVNVGAYK